MQHAALRVPALAAEIKLVMAVDLAPVELDPKLHQLLDPCRSLLDHGAHHRLVTSPAPASSVSRTCRSKLSSMLVTQAMPPWAQAVLLSSPRCLVTMQTVAEFGGFQGGAESGDAAPDDEEIVGLHGWVANRPLG